MARASSGLRRACFIAMAVAIGPGCTWARRASVGAVDPQLRAKGERLERGDSEPGFLIGAFQVSTPKLSRHEGELKGMLQQEATPRPIEQHQLELGVSAADGGETFNVRCVSQRRRPGAVDYAAVLDENRDEIAVQCDVGDWAFRTEAELSHNFAGSLSESGSDRTLTVEVVVWVERFGAVRRHLPEPIAQIRDGERALAAMVLGKPETAWLAPAVEPEIAGVAMSTMLALRFLPLGLE